MRSIRLPLPVPALVALVALVAVAALAALAALLARGPEGEPAVEPTPRGDIGIYGKLTDLETGRPVEGVCVTIGRPGDRCWATTDANGNYAIDGTDVIQPSDTVWELFFLKRGEYPLQKTDLFKIPGGTVRKDWKLGKAVPESPRPP